MARLSCVACGGMTGHVHPCPVQGTTYTAPPVNVTLHGLGYPQDGQALPVVVNVQHCLMCGALVVDSSQHILWHNSQIERMAEVQKRTEAGPRTVRVQ